MNYFDLICNRLNENSNKDCIIINNKKFTYKDVYDYCSKIKESINTINGNSSSKILILCNDYFNQICLFIGISGSNNIPIICHYNLPENIIKDMTCKNSIDYIISDKELNFNEVNKMYEFYIYKTHTPQKILTLKNDLIGVLSSGTTGIPKVFFRTYASWCDFYKIQNDIFKINKNSVVFMNGSFSFTGNLNIFLGIMYKGASAVITSKILPRTWINEINKYNVTNIYLIPSKLRLLTNVLNKKNNNIKSIFTTSQLLFEECIKVINKFYTKSDLILCYGTSEVSYISYITLNELNNKPLSVGRPFKDIKVTIENEKIFVDTPYGIESIQYPFCTNDTGYVDDDGYLFLTGRSDDIINVAGIKVSLFNIENAIKSIDSVTECAVINYDDSARTNGCAAFIICHKPMTKNYIYEQLKIKLSPYEIPKKIFFIKEFPLNDSGKINKNALKSKYI